MTKSDAESAAMAPHSDGGRAVDGASSSSRLTASWHALTGKLSALWTRPDASIEAPRASWPMTQHDSEARERRFWTPPRRLLRTQRRLSQRVNLGIVKAAAKEARIRSYQRNSVSSCVSTSSESSLPEEDGEMTGRSSLSLTDRLSLSVIRRFSHTLPLALVQSSEVECKVREYVYTLLQDESHFEGQACAVFFQSVEEFKSTNADMCRAYLKHVRELMRDLVEFIIAFRAIPMTLMEESDGLMDEVPSPWELQSAVQQAVEEFFCFSIRYQLPKWIDATISDKKDRRFERQLERWSRLTTAPNQQLLARFECGQLESDMYITHAVHQLKNINASITPSRKMHLLVNACRSISLFLSQQHPSAATAPLQRFRDDQFLGEEVEDEDMAVCFGDADSFLSVLIFAVSRSGVRDPFHQLALLDALYPFASQYGEFRFYLTMWEASLEYLRKQALS